ncbi:MAG: zf-HC2 domain-containing protein [Bacteroidota bacterium]|nr:zf-HC2 domain-containing protein [Bacteroidota bacterium]
MNICETIQNDFIPYLEKSLATESVERIEEHLANCSECAGFMAELQLSFRSIADEKYVEEPASFLEGIENKIANQQSQNKKPRIKHYLLQSLSYAAVIVIGLFAGSLIVGSITKNDIPAGQSITSSDFYWNDLEQEPIESFLMNEILF